MHKTIPGLRGNSHSLLGTPHCTLMYCTVLYCTALPPSLGLTSSEGMYFYALHYPFLPTTHAINPIHPPLNPSPLHSYQSPLSLPSPPLLPSPLRPPLHHPHHSLSFPHRDDNELDQRMRKIENIYVAVIADSSELASAMPSLLEGVGALSANVTILHDFDSTNQVSPLE